MLQSQAKYIKLMSLRDKSNWIWVSWRFTQSCHCIINKVVERDVSQIVKFECLIRLQLWLALTDHTKQFLTSSLYLMFIWFFFKTETSCQFQRILINTICLFSFFLNLGIVSVIKNSFSEGWITYFKVIYMYIYIWYFVTINYYLIQKKFKYFNVKQFEQL